eukprot:TRINITY_DN728_c1_g2_i1.p1 TRINITY_DN728_c1_g2~~TRINITY_DN728_c1_g2_i1.p1  ORF type:complete len:116 (-),score=42.89 TRINITY_DN728_c1_g2_i1:86-433(-)
MRNIAAYLLAVLGGNSSPDAAAITKILASVGVAADADKINKLVSELKGKDINDVIAKGSTKLASLSVGGGSAPAAAAPAKGGKEAAAAPAKKEEKKKEPEPEEEEDGEMGFGLFD